MVSRVEFLTLRAERFGSLDDCTVSFQSGINLLVGPAESGKTTILNALKAVLYHESDAEVLTLPYQRPHGDAPRLTLCFAVEGKKFTLVRDYQRQMDELTDNDGISYQGAEIKEKLHRYFGTDSGEIFNLINTASIEDIGAPEERKFLFQAALEAPVFAGFDRGRADKYIAQEIGKLEKSTPNAKGELDIISEHLSARLQEKNALDERLDTVKKQKKELEELQTQAMKFQKESMHLEEQAIGAEAYLQLNAKMITLEEKLHIQLDKYSRAEQIVEDLERIERERERLVIPDPMQMAELTDRRIELNEAVDKAKEHMDSVGGGRKTAGRGFIGASLILLVICLTYLLEQSGYFEAGEAGQYILYSIPVMAVIWLVRLGSYVFKLFAKQNATRQFRNSVAALDAFFAEINEKYELKAADPIEELEERIQRVQYLGMSSDNLHATIGHLSDDKGMEFLTQQKLEIEGEVARLNAEMAPLVQFAASATRLPQVKEEATAKKVRGRALLERAKQMEAQLTVTDSIEAKIVSVEKEMETLKTRHKEVTEKLEILKITRLALNRAADNLLEDTFVSFSRSAGVFLATITDNRYDEVVFSKEPITFSVKTGDGEKIQNIAALSMSTRDAVHLSLRLGAMSHLSFDFAAPFIVDLAERRLDNTRRENFYKILVNLSKRRQILLAAHEHITLPGAPNTIQCAELTGKFVTA
ncbi:MAG: AAA family ATPase [Candidatus Zixiibacteriota bacterium]